MGILDSDILNLVYLRNAIVHLHPISASPNSDHTWDTVPEGRESEEKVRIARMPESFMVDKFLNTKFNGEQLPPIKYISDYLARWSIYTTCRFINDFLARAQVKHWYAGQVTKVENMFTD